MSELRIEPFTNEFGQTIIPGDEVVYVATGMYSQCYIENINGLWYIVWPDCTRAWRQGYKTRGWAQRTLNWLNK